MIINSSQNIQSNNPLGSIGTRRVNTAGGSTANASTEDKKTVEAQTQQDSSVIRQLRARDREVRSHEAAHAAAGGSLVRGGPSFTLQQGPDGRSYAIGGEVQLDVSAVSGDPQATVAKAQRVQAAALAPAQPSAQDFKVAGSASQMAARARVEIAVERREEAQPAEGAKEETSPAAETEQAGATGQFTGPSNEVSGENVAATGRVNRPADITPSSDALQGIPETILKSNDVPAAAISSFIATAQSEVQSIQFSQFA